MLGWMSDELDQLRSAGLYRERRRLSSGQAAEVRYRLADCVNFSSNDYLAYAGDPRLARAAGRAAHRYGCGAGASPLITGHLPPLRALERDLATWEGTEAALVFPSGFMANVGVISALAGKQDALFSDASNHASLIDGCRQSRAAVHVYQHNNPNHLADLLRREGAKARHRLIVSDSVFSMDGDLARLADLLDLAKVHDALVILDEAHATGVLGERGCGLSETLGEEAQNVRLVKTGTLSKALGTQGGFVVGSQLLIDYLVNRARPYIFSTALAPPLAAAARRAVHLVQREPDRRRHTLALAEQLRVKLHDGGCNIGPSVCHIIPVIVGDANQAVELSHWLETQRLLVPAIRPPSVAAGSSRLRISLTAGHTEEDVARLANALAQRMCG